MAANRFLIAVGTVAAIASGCFQSSPGDPYELQLAAKGPGSIEILLDRCDKKGYRGTIVDAEVTVASVDDFLKRKATFTPIGPGVGGQTWVDLPAAIAKDLERLTGSSDHVLAVHFSLRGFSSGEISTHEVAVGLEERVVTSMESPDDGADASACVWS